MQGESLDALIVASPANVRYLSNYEVLTGRAMVLVPEGDEPTLFIDQDWDLARAKDVSSISDTRALTDFGRSIGEGLSRGSAKKVGVVGWDGFPTPIYQSLTKKVPAAEFVDSTRALEGIRLTKSAFEIKLLKEAAAITGAGAEAAAKAAKTGKTELEIAVAVESTMRTLGAEGPSFPTVVGSGDRTNLIVPMPTKRRPMRGDLVLFDLGAKYNGYRGDITRTKAYGKLGKEQEDLFEVVAHMHREGVEAVKPGVIAADIHDLTKKVARESGFGEYVMHMTGHGLGLEEHERPFLEAERTKLAPGMVITIEPGLYVPKVGGVRIEDTILVGDSGGKVITSVDREL